MYYRPKATYASKFTAKARTLLASTLVMLVMAISVGILSTQATALPADIEIQRFLLAAQKHLDNKNYRASEAYLNRILELESSAEIELPVEFYYYYGVVLHNGKQYEKALQHYESYIIHTGKEGKFYQQTLQAITDTEESQSIKKNSDLNVAEQQSKRTDIIGQLSEANLSKDNDYDINIKNLYLSVNIKNALVLHINSILSTYPYSGTRIQKDNRHNAITYSVRINDSNDIITQRKDNTLAKPLLSSHTYPVYGANPFINHKCYASEARCEIRTPNGNNIWVELSYEKKAAEEIAYAFSRLIKALQRSH